MYNLLEKAVNTYMLHISTFFSFNSSSEPMSSSASFWCTHTVPYTSFTGNCIDYTGMLYNTTPRIVPSKASS